MTGVLSDRREAVVDALRTVLDPELDESIVDLNFVTSSTVDGAHAEVRLRLPTYFCSPNFAYLMVADAYDAARSVPGVESASIVLEDHFASDAINSGVAAGAGFVGSFPDEAGSELDDLRRNFQRKAHVAAMERACRRLLADGWTIESLPHARLADLPAGAERERLLRRRADVDLPLDPGCLVLVGDDGAPVAPDDALLRLRFARAVRVSIDGNAHFCRGLLATRYPGSAAEEVSR
ncbi:MAG TPA: iron-sulfur cluster assembly protein [Jatrophihabitantaceae bacterium]|nr:iron-sulfur cluster assembly protein [Jatrophihabitantaceae bacterium]